MPRYTTRPQTRAMYDSHSLWSDGETEGREVHDDGTWSEDQPTGLLIRVIEAGERFMVHGFDATDALAAFFRDVVAGTGIERIQSEMRRQGLAA